MLQPNKTKFRKQQRGRRRGIATRGNDVSFGEFGLSALEPGWITNRQIEAARIALQSTALIRRPFTRPANDSGGPSPTTS